MERYKFPEQKTVFAGRPFGGEVLAGAFADIFQAPKGFTGYLKVATGDETLYFLFFLKGDPYAAGKFTGRKPENISITRFFAELKSLPPATLSVSLHEIDPVLLKCLLIFLQDEPTAKAPVNLIDLEQIARQIQGEAADALIVLEKQGFFNFYFFKDGKAAISRMADTGGDTPADLSVDEQMLLYAFQSDTVPVMAHIYRTITTEQASDAEHISRTDLLAMARGGDPEGAAPQATAEVSQEVTMTVFAGAQQGKTFIVTLPCTLGRKSCDLVITDALVSRTHAQLQAVEGGVVIEDLGSTNGTLINGVPVKKQLLAQYDVITLGETKITISW